MEHLHTLVQSHAVIISALILLTAYVFIALEKIPKVTVALLGRLDNSAWIGQPDKIYRRSCQCKLFYKLC